MRQIRIATRGSHLALAQAKYVQELIHRFRIPTEIIIIKTTGDLHYASFSELAKRGEETKGLFTKEIQEALLDYRADIAVHSLKDLPTKEIPELVIASLPQRLDFRDYLIFRKDRKVSDSFPYIRENGIVGTSSFRRRSLLKYLCPSLEVKEIRGNVPTRIKKIFFEDIDAILLSGAGIERLSQTSEWIEETYLKEIEIIPLDPEFFPPTPGQGTIAVECRRDDREILSLLQNFHNKEIEEIISIERGLLAKLEGGCHLPLGIHVKKEPSAEMFRATVYVGKEYPYSRKHKTFFIQRYHKDQHSLVRFLHEEITEKIPVVLFGKEESLKTLQEKFNGYPLYIYPVMTTYYYPSIQKKLWKSSREQVTKTIYAIFSKEGIRSLQQLHFEFEKDSTIFLNGKKSRETLLHFYPEIDEKQIYLSEDGTAHGLAKKIMESGIFPSKIIAITAKESREEFFDFFMSVKSENFSLEQWMVYETRTRTLTKEEILSIPEKAYLLFGSPSLFNGFLASFRKNHLDFYGLSKNWRFVTLGKTTFIHIINQGFSPYAMAKEPDYEKVIEEFL